MRSRVDKLGVSQPEIQRSGKDEIDVALPDEHNIKRAEEKVGKTAQLNFYDWEPNVIGPSGKPEPSAGTVTGDSTTGGAGGVDGGPDPVPGRAAGGQTARRCCAGATPPGPRDARPSRRTDASTAAGTCSTPPTKRSCAGPKKPKANLYQGLKHEPPPCKAGEPGCVPKGAKLKAVRVNPGTVVVQAHPVENENGKVTNTSPNSYYVLNDNPVLKGSDITNPQQGFDEGAGGSGQPNVTFGFTGHGKSVFERITKEIAHRGQEAQLPGVTKNEALQHFAVELDGQLITVPSIDYTQYPEGIDASTGSQISGGFTITTAQNLANELQSGALPLRLKLISRSQVSATLGKTALEQGLIAGLVGFAVVCIFLIVFYRMLGLIAVGGLFIYGVYFFALIKLIPITLTLPGIAGLILTIGVCADANIVIFERVKEEIRSGRSVVSGIATGYKRGFAAIVDANVVTFMTAFILFALATAEVKGFAFTLGIGTLVSLFTAVLATQAALGAMGRSRFVTHPAALGATPRRGKGWTFDFMGHSKWFFALSGTILLIGALAIGGRGLNFGIDFKSGTRIQTALVDQHVTEAEVAKVMAENGLGNAEVQKISNANVGGAGFQISTKTLGPEQVDKIQEALEKKFGTAGPTGRAGFVKGTKNFSSTSIGPTFGKTVANSAIIAIIASLLVISAYIALRFEWKYAVPVLIALMHDLLITAGVYSLTGREVTTATVAALLTILGYSLYDTIIVFDRVRENVPRMPRAAFSQIVNRSMSEVLTRSLATSFCTLLPVLALLFFGGETLKDFAFALMVGIASGAYSSIFIASPVLTHWKEREPGYRSRRERIVRETGARPRVRHHGRRGARGRRARRQAPAQPPRQPDRPGGAGRAALPRRVPGAGRRPRHRHQAQGGSGHRALQRQNQSRARSHRHAPAGQARRQERPSPRPRTRWLPSVTPPPTSHPRTWCSRTSRKHGPSSRRNRRHGRSR